MINFLNKNELSTKTKLFQRIRKATVIVSNLLLLYLHHIEQQLKKVSNNKSEDSFFTSQDGSQNQITRRE